MIHSSILLWVLWNEVAKMADILVVNGEIVWTGDELYIAEGYEAIDQEAYLRASCDIGEDVFYSDYGSRIFEYLGKPYSESNKSLIEAEAKEALLKTQGIKEVLNADLKYIKIDDSVLPCIYAKFKYTDSDEIMESKFKFKV